ncbi:hypothetical protein GCM10017620_18770 [Brevundimonas intermedia]|uniref:Tetratricopeptide repeat protein n=1 Tax=Brevundimonas intermedia TaxID=74315 RepID=A0ABQ5T804_9CAUL|nr:hypothetical protein [Brevundimonas intermedia]GLK48904.1 hypothetical protein GCM10017620_18770 [Brevundimonas intermedia]
MKISGLGAVVAVALAALSLPATARADWLKAESERFIVYSEGNERSLRDYVQKLETFDRVMRYRSGFAINEAPARKLPIYLVNSRSGLLRVHPYTPKDVVGTYFPTSEDIFAVAIRGENDEVLLHEYVHHFMLGSMPSAYPGWFVEGFAEYYMTADIDGGRIQVGGYSDNRAYWLFNGSWIPLEMLLRSRPADVTRSSYRETYYPVAWLLTHWFFSDPARLQQLSAYLTAVSDGGDPVEAMETATGMTMGELRAALRRYLNQRSLVVRVITGDFPPADISVTRLPRSANDLLLINQRLKIGVNDEDRTALGQEVARIAARHGDDPLALLAAGHAGMHFGDRPAGERALQRLIELEPDNVEALQFLAQERLRQARDVEEQAEMIALKRQARDYLSRAYVAAENDYRTLMLIGEMRSGESNYPTENDLLTLGLAFDRAPQLAEVRLAYASALIETEDKETALTLLAPLANNPHGGEAADYAARIIAALKNGDPLPSPDSEVISEAGVPPEPEDDPESPPAPASE